jgi:hypothetical protein
MQPSAPAVHLRGPVGVPRLRLVRDLDPELIDDRLVFIRLIEQLKILQLWMAENEKNLSTPTLIYLTMWSFTFLGYARVYIRNTRPVTII